MSTSIYTEKFIEPNEKMLRYDLGTCEKYFDSICNHVKKDFGELAFEWKFYSKKSGWILKMLNKARNILFIIPNTKSFTVVFIFGGKATEYILSSDLPEHIKQELFQAKNYAEGKTIRLNVKNKADVDHILSLINIKMRF